MSTAPVVLATATITELLVEEAAADVHVTAAADGRRPRRAAFLTTREASRLLGLSRRTVLRHVILGRLAGLVLTPRLVRVAAAAVDPSAPPAIPDQLPAVITIHWLAAHWRVSAPMLRRLAAAGHVPLRRRGRHEAWRMNARTFRAFALRSNPALAGDA